MTAEDLYGDLALADLRGAFETVSAELGRAHYRRMVNAVERGGGTAVTAEDFSFGVSDSPDIMEGGYFSGETDTYYKVTLHRFEAPDVFKLREDRAWIEQRIFDIELGRISDR